MGENKIYRITQFANLIGVSAGTLRNWDRIGKLKACRTRGGQRYYTHRHYLGCMGKCEGQMEVMIDE